MTLIGGIGTMIGPVIGAFVVEGMQAYARSFGAWVTIIRGPYSPVEFVGAPGALEATPAVRLLLQISELASGGTIFRLVEFQQVSCRAVPLFDPMVEIVS